MNSWCSLSGNRADQALARSAVGDSILRTMAITSRILGERGRRQAEKLGIDPKRVPPGQYLTERFPVLTVGPNPKFDLETWDFTVFGQVADRLELSWDELMELPQTDVVTD